MKKKKKGKECYLEKRCKAMLFKINRILYKMVLNDLARLKDLIGNLILKKKFSTNMG